MKTILQVSALLTILFLVTGCEEGEPENILPETLIGNWTAVSFDASIETTTDFLGTTTVTATVIEGSNFNYDLDFEDTNYTTSGSYDLTVFSTVGGLKFSEEITTPYEGSQNGTYTIEGDELKLNGIVMSFEIPQNFEGEFPEEQTISYNFNNDGELVLLQKEEIDVLNDEGLSVKTLLTSNSIFRRK